MGKFGVKRSGLLFGQGEYDLTNERVALLILVANVLKCTHPWHYWLRVQY